MARRQLKSSPSPAGIGDLPVHERMLPNGLKALVLPVRRAPIVVCDLYYPVGSYDEPPGLSGLAHFVEHMLFKGTDRFPKGQIDRLVADAAGQSNAETSEDYTHYWFAFPTADWELALTIEADRMRGVRFDPDEVEAERRVIGEERARELNSPQGRLDQTHLVVTYLRHPYRNPILGWPDDIARITAHDLTSFYRAHYRSQGAVLVVAGDVDPDDALRSIDRHFADIRAEPRPDRERPTLVEPAQTGRRAFTLGEAEAAPRGLFGWRTVARGHEDVPALDVLADILCSGRRSRLWQSMIETDQTATWIESAHATAHRAGQLFIQIEAASEREIGGIERAVVAELARLAGEGPTADELARSRRRVEAAWRWEYEDLNSLTLGLGVAALWDDWRNWQAEHRAALALGADDVRRVTRTYLTDEKLTIGWSVPLPGRRRGQAIERSAARDSIDSAPRGGNAISPPTAATPGATRSAARLSAPRSGPILGPRPRASSRLVDYQPRRLVLDNGLRLIFERRPGCGVVALELYADAGLLRESGPGVACLTGRLLEEGTTTRSAATIAEAIEDVGGSLEVGSTGGSVRVRREDVELAIELLADIAIRPSFPAEAVDWTARRIAAELKGELEDPAFRAELAFRALVYGAHPLARDPRGSVREIARVTRSQLVEHHQRFFTPGNTILVAVGDFDPRRLAGAVRAQFGRWAPASAPLPPIPVATGQVRPRVRSIHHPGEQVHVVLGHLGIARSHPDHDALVVLDHVFGSGPGFCDRLGRILRDELGLVYAIGGGMTDSADVAPGLFRVYAGTTPDHVERVTATITDQIGSMHAGEFTDAEVERARRYVAGAWVFDFQNVEQRAERLLDLERWGLSLDEPRDWPARIEALTPSQIREAARRHLNPRALTRVELGPVRGRP